MAERGRGATRSLRVRLTAVAVAVVAVLLAVGGVAAIRLQEQRLASSLDDELRSLANDVSRLASVGNGERRRFPGPVDLPGELRRRPVQLLDADGEVVAASGEFAGVGPLVEVDGLGRREYRTVEANGTRYRVLAVPVGDDQTLVVAADLTDLDRSVDVLRVILVVGGPLLLVALGSVIWVTAGRALGPVEVLRSEVDDIGPEELERRVTVPDTTELAELASTMNGMLERLETAAEQQRRFVADASHELRSPLAGIRAQLEVELRRSPEEQDWDTAGDRVLTESIRMQRLIEDLLVLARGDAGGARVRSVPVDVDDVVLAEVARLRPTLADHTVDLTGVTGAQALADEHDLGRILVNLLSNAARHARSRITVTSREVDGRVEVAVADDGSGVPDGQAERVFDRFMRLDDARDRDTGGSGLGLAISRELARRHGGTLVVDAEYADGARLVLRLPASD